MDLVIQSNEALDGARHKVPAESAEAIWNKRGWETVGPAANQDPNDVADFRTVEEAEAEAEQAEDEDTEAPDTGGFFDAQTAGSTDEENQLNESEED